MSVSHFFIRNAVRIIQFARRALLAVEFKLGSAANAPNVTTSGNAYKMQSRLPYAPKYFRIEVENNCSSRDDDVNTELKRQKLYDIIERYAFGMLILVDGDSECAREKNVEPIPFVTQVPFLVDKKRGKIQCHVALANPAAEARDGQLALVVFHGPHAYISPRHYLEVNQPAVPTWNYVTVHVYGRIRKVPVDIETQERLTAKFEATVMSDGKPFVNRDYMSNASLEAQIRHIQGLEIDIERVIGKLKLSQNKNESLRRAVIKGLRQRGETELAEFHEQTLDGGLYATEKKFIDILALQVIKV